MHKSTRVDDLQGPTNASSFLADLPLSELLDFLASHGLNKITLALVGPDDVSEIFFDYVLAHLYDTFVFEGLKMARHCYLH